VQSVRAQARVHVAMASVQLGSPRRASSWLLHIPPNILKSGQSQAGLGAAATQLMQTRSVARVQLARISQAFFTSSTPLWGGSSFGEQLAIAATASNESTFA
jgi:hypothetical protein